MNDESKSTVSKWQDEQPQRLAAKGVEVSQEEEGRTFHCRRCHRNLPMPDYAKHYKSCPGFASKCYETCPPTGEPLDTSRKPG